MKPLNRGAELRKPHKDRSHPDYKSSIMFSTGEIRVRPARRRCAQLEGYGRMADGSFKAFTEMNEADYMEHLASKVCKTRAERRAARDAGLARAGAKLASGVCCGTLPMVPTAPAVRKGDALC